MTSSISGLLWCDV